MYRRMPIAAVGAVIAAALAVTGCGSSKKSTTTSNSSAAATSTSSSASSSSSSGSSGSHNKNLVLIQGTKADNFYVTMGCGAQAEAQKLGYSIKVEGPAEFAPNEQIPIVDAVTATKPAAVMIAPTDAEALISPMQSMKSAGIKVIQVDTHVNNNSIASASISSNNVEGGELAAQELAKEIGDKGSVVVMNEEAGVSTTEARIQGFMTGIKKYSGITVLPTQYVGDNPAKADSAITAEYAAHHNLAGVFATNVLVAQGVGTGLKTAGISGKVKMIGYDADPTQIQQLRSGIVNALIAQEPYQEGVDGVQQAVNAITGKPTQSTLTGLKVLTLSNLSANSSYIYKSSC